MERFFKSAVLALQTALEDALQSCPGVTVDSVDWRGVDLVETYVVFPDGLLGVRVVVSYTWNGSIYKGTALYAGG